MKAKTIDADNYKNIEFVKPVRKAETIEIQYLYNHLLDYSNPEFTHIQIRTLPGETIYFGGKLYAGSMTFHTKSQNLERHTIYNADNPLDESIAYTLIADEEIINGIAKSWRNLVQIVLGDQYFLADSLRWMLGLALQGEEDLYQDAVKVLEEAKRDIEYREAEFVLAHNAYTERFKDVTPIGAWVDENGKITFKKPVGA